MFSALIQCSAITGANKKIIIDKRVHGNLQDDSIEWYFIEPEELKKIIEVNLIICR